MFKNLLFLCFLVFSLQSCKESAIERVKESETFQRVYSDALIKPDCSDEVARGFLQYIEFSTLDKKEILGRISHFNDSVIGSAKTRPNPWTVSKEWIENQVFVHPDYNYFGYEIFPLKAGNEDKLMYYGRHNTSVDGRVGDFSYFYSLYICPIEPLENDEFEEYGISIRRAMLSAEEVDSIYSPNPPSTGHPYKTRLWLRFGIREYMAKIVISLNFGEGRERPEHYQLIMKDKIKVYTWGPKKK